MLLKILAFYDKYFNRNVNSAFSVQSIRRNGDDIIFYCKDDNNTRAVFTMTGSELVFKRQDLLDKFSIADKIKIITLTVSASKNVTITEQQSSSVYFPLLAMLFSSCLLISNITAQKLVPLFNFTITGSGFIYFFTYILGDIITDVYGYKKSRQLIWCTVGINLLAVLCYKFAIYLPASPYWHKAFSQVKCNLAVEK